MPYIRATILLVISVAIAIFLSNWLEVGQFDILILAAVLAPLGVLQTFHANVEGFYNPQSIVFTKYHSLFRFLSAILGVMFLFGLYKYFLIYGIWKTLIVFLLTSVIQAPLYALLKLRIGMEILLYPVSIIAIILFFVFIV